MNSEDLKLRTKKFALRVIKLGKILNKDEAERIIAKQIIRCGTSVASNYRSALRGKSKADFIAKLGTVIEEADETMFWLEILWESGILKKDLLQDLYKETNEIVAIMVKTRSTAIKNKS